jgi:hypothetical protein
MDATEFQAVIRSMIQHEDTLRDQRLGWLFALNGFLFAALGFAWADAQSTSLVLVLSGVGAVVALSVQRSLSTSVLAIRRLSRIAHDADSFGISGAPPVIGMRSSEREGERKRAKAERRQAGSSWLAVLDPWRFLPWCLAAAWLAIAVLRLTRE